MGDAIYRYGVVAIVGAVVGILFHAAIVVADVQGGPLGILVSAAFGAVFFIAIDAFTEGE